MKTGTGVEELLRFCFNNLKGFNVYSTDGRDLLSEPLKCAQVA
jgi:hypothetical protein